LTGAASIILYFVGFALIGEVGGTSTPSAEEVVDLLEDSPVQVLAGAYISLVSVALLVWFAARVRSTLFNVEGGTGRLSAAAFGGAVVAAAAMAVGFASIGQAALRADSARGIDPTAATLYYDLYRALLGGPLPVGMAVFIGATAAVSLRSALLPSWLAWASVAVAIGCVSPLLFIFAFIALVWVLVLSIWLFFDGRGESSRANV
jgi:hypothetical protein